jgi:hypothetical protein
MPHSATARCGLGHGCWSPAAQRPAAQHRTKRHEPRVGAPATQRQCFRSSSAEPWHRKAEQRKAGPHQPTGQPSGRCRSASCSTFFPGCPALHCTLTGPFHPSAPAAAAATVAAFGAASRSEPSAVPSCDRAAGGPPTPAGWSGQTDENGSRAPLPRPSSCSVGSRKCGGLTPRTTSSAHCQPQMHGAPLPNPKTLKP